MAEWTHRSCEHCYIGKQVEQSDPNDQWVEIKIPVLLSQQHVAEEGPGYCCFCGQPTVIGLFVRHDPERLDCSHEEDK